MSMKYIQYSQPKHQRSGISQDISHVSPPKSLQSSYVTTKSALHQKRNSGSRIHKKLPLQGWFHIHKVQCGRRKVHKTPSQASFVSNMIGNSSKKENSIQPDSFAMSMAMDSNGMNSTRQNRFTCTKESFISTSNLSSCRGSSVKRTKNGTRRVIKPNHSSIHTDTSNQRSITSSNVPSDDFQNFMISNADGNSTYGLGRRQIAWKGEVGVRRTTSHEPTEREMPNINFAAQPQSSRQLFKSSSQPKYAQFNQHISPKNEQAKPLNPYLSNLPTTAIQGLNRINFEDQNDSNKFQNPIKFNRQNRQGNSFLSKVEEGKGQESSSRMSVATGYRGSVINAGQSSNQGSEVGLTVSSSRRKQLQPMSKMGQGKMTFNLANIGLTKKPTLKGKISLKEKGTDSTNMLLSQPPDLKFNRKKLSALDPNVAPRKCEISQPKLSTPQVSGETSRHYSRGISCVSGVTLNSDSSKVDLNRYFPSTLVQQQQNQNQFKIPQNALKPKLKIPQFTDKKPLQWDLSKLGIQFKPKTVKNSETRIKLKSPLTNPKLLNLGKHQLPTPNALFTPKQDGDDSQGEEDQSPSFKVESATKIPNFGGPPPPVPDVIQMNKTAQFFSPQEHPHIIHTAKPEEIKIHDHSPTSRVSTESDLIKKNDFNYQTPAISGSRSGNDQTTMPSSRGCNLNDIPSMAIEQPSDTNRQSIACLANATFSNFNFMKEQMKQSTDTTLKHPEEHSFEQKQDMSQVQEVSQALEEVKMASENLSKSSRKILLSKKQIVDKSKEGQVKPEIISLREDNVGVVGVGMSKKSLKLNHRNVEKVSLAQKQIKFIGKHIQLKNPAIHDKPPPVPQQVLNEPKLTRKKTRGSSAPKNLNSSQTDPQKQSQTSVKNIAPATKQTLSNKLNLTTNKKPLKLSKISSSQIVNKNKKNIKKLQMQRTTCNIPKAQLKLNLVKQKPVKKVNQL